MKYRPRKQEYEGFMKEFSGELKIHFPNVCFGCYGSMANGNPVYGKADVDGFLIMDSGMVSDKKVVRGLSQILARALSNNPVKTQFNLLDLETIKDGRFMSFTDDYTDWFRERAKVVCGPDCIGRMNGQNPKYSVLDSAAFNFCGPGGVRNTALYSFSHLQNSLGQFEDRVQDAIDKVAKFPKKLVFLRTGRLIPDRRESQRIVEGNLFEIDYELLDELNYVLDNVEELDRRLRDPQEALRLLYNGLEVMEQMIFAYTERHPKIGKREVGIARD